MSVGLMGRIMYFKETNLVKQAERILALLYVVETFFDFNGR